MTIWLRNALGWLANAIVAKSVLRLPTTVELILGVGYLLKLCQQMMTYSATKTTQWHPPSNSLV